MRIEDAEKDIRSQTRLGAVLGIVFGIVFFGIGITVIVSVWSGDGFGAPPNFFRIFASLIAVCFVAMGGALAYASARTLSASTQRNSLSSGAAQPTPRQTETRVTYVCPACGAPLASGADVSPQGDVKCSHCGGWFNIHKA